MAHSHSQDTQSLSDLGACTCLEMTLQPPLSRNQLPGPPPFLHTSAMVADSLLPTHTLEGRFLLARGTQSSSHLGRPAHPSAIQRADYTPSTEV